MNSLRYNITLSIILLSIIIFINSCQTEKQTDGSLQESSGENEKSADIITPPFFHSTPTQEPSLTPTPTPIIFPVGNGTPIPSIEYEVLSPENISLIQPVAKYGAPERIRIEMDPGQKYIYIATIDGLKYWMFRQKK